MRDLRKLIIEGFDTVIEYSVADTKVIVYNLTFLEAYFLCPFTIGFSELEEKIITHVESLSLTFTGTHVLWSDSDHIGE